MIMIPNPATSEKEVLYLDTETTDLHEHAEIIELAIINKAGTVLFDTRIQCQGDIPLEVQDIHGISKSDLVDCPTWPEVHDQVMSILLGAKAIKIYNSGFDMRLLKQTAARYGLSVPVEELPPIVCVMHRYANTFTGGQWVKLVDACSYEQIALDESRAHSAQYDAELTRQLNIALDEHFEEENRRREASKARRQASEKRKQKKMTLVPENYRDFPEYGMMRPDGAKTMSELKISELNDYEFIGTCSNTFGGKGYLFAPRKTELL